MKMKVSGFENIQLVGHLMGIHQADGHLNMNIRLTTPVGWHAKASLTHRDVLRIFWLLLKPANLLYVLFGFGKPGSRKMQTR